MWHLASNFGQAKTAPVVLVMTPALHGGSWLCLRDLAWAMAKASPTPIRIVVVALGSPEEVESDRHRIAVEYNGIQALRYDRYGRLINTSTLVAALYELPLLALAVWLGLKHRPVLVVANGFVAAGAGLLLSKVIGARLVVAHHGVIRGYISPLFQKLARFLFADSVTLTVANSTESKNDLSAIMPPERIAVLEHWVPEVFFEPVDRAAIREKRGFDGRFVILYVGRIDKEKHADLMLYAAKQMRGEPAALFVFVGAGALLPEVTAAQEASGNVRYLGYVSDQKQLRDLYAAADIVWSSAGHSYLTKPAIEALACGTPVLIPDRPATVSDKKVNPSVVPPGVGWLAPTDNPNQTVALLQETCSMDSSKIRLMREACRRYAVERFSERKLAEMADTVLGLLNPARKAVNGFWGRD